MLRPHHALSLQAGPSPSACLGSLVSPAVWRQAALTCRACGCCAQDERKKIFGGMHYSNPVPVMTMLEVIYTEETSQEAVDIMMTVGEAQDKAISLVRDMPGTYGFILNRVFAAAAREGAPPSLLVQKFLRAVRSERLAGLLQVGRLWTMGSRPLRTWTRR